MPKRPNPFGDSSPLQFKSHIAQKDVDTGVNHGHKMQNVYAHTRELLFSGIRQANSSLSSCDEHPAMTTPNSSPTKLLAGQPLIDSTLLFRQAATTCARQLNTCYDTEEMECEEQSSNDNNDNNNTPTKQTAPAVQMGIDPVTGRLIRNPGVSSSSSILACHSCCRQGDALRSLDTCPRCEKATCRSCTRLCSLCAKRLCSLCCTTYYEHCDDVIYCLDCMSS